MTANKNIACRIFKDQLQLIKQLPEGERAEVLWRAVNESFNQFDYQNENQTENQNDCALMSESLSSIYNNNISSLGKCIIDLLSKNIVWREFSINYGGRRERSGRKKSEQKESNSVIQTSSTGYSDAFLAFWEIYPRQRRGSKEKAYKAYQKALKRGNTDSDILSKTRLYCDSDEVASGYAKGCEAWLNADGFLNDYTIKAGKERTVGNDYNKEKVNWGDYAIKPKQL